MKTGIELKKIAVLFCLIIPILLAVITLTTFVTTSEVVKDLKVVIDADPGPGDAMAMLMLLSKMSEANIVRVTCVDGITPVKNATANALAVLEVADRLDIPLFVGSPQGLVHKLDDKDYIEKDGWGYVIQKPPKRLISRGHAAFTIVNMVHNYPGEITILCTGPLTNIALALHLYPRLFKDLKEIIILGGTYKGGTVPKEAVDNFAHDPESASFVFSKVPQDKLVTLLPLETIDSNALPMTWRRSVLGEIDSTYISFINRAERLLLRNSDRWLPSEQMAAAILLNPNLVTDSIEAKISVETCGERGRGTVFVDYIANQKNARIVTDIDKELFQNMLMLLLSSN